MKLKNDKQEVLNVLNAWIHAYETRDLEKFRAIVSSSEKHISWGTGIDERYEGFTNFLKQVQRDFEQSESAKLKVLQVYSVVYEQSAWLTAEIEPTVGIQGAIHTLPILRSTLVLGKRNGEWKIEHHHCSWPHPEQKEGRSFL